MQPLTDEDAQAQLEDLLADMSDDEVNDLADIAEAQSTEGDAQ